ncbi:response regulator [Phormidium tenue FACHB-886]|nr:response regulator [Phormidium tenue FACHB-886]
MGDCYILVVDDSLDNLLFMECFLKAEGYQVAIAQNGTAALAQVAASPPNLILLDLMMPEMNGLEVSERIRQHDEYFDIPILLVTAHGEVVLGQALPTGINGVLSKPVDFDELLETVQAFC